MSRTKATAIAPVSKSSCAAQKNSAARRGACGRNVRASVGWPISSSLANNSARSAHARGCSAPCRISFARSYPEKPTWRLVAKELEKAARNGNAIEELCRTEHWADNGRHSMPAGLTPRPPPWTAKRAHCLRRNFKAAPRPSGHLSKIKSGHLSKINMCEQTAGATVLRGFGRNRLPS
jgi:hypothetical protein